MSNQANISSTPCGIALSGDAGIDLSLVNAAKPFTNWLAEVDRERFKVQSIHVQSVDMFGPRVGFVKFKVEVTDADGRALPGIIFARGGSVSVLAVLLCEGKSYVVTTVQPRLATGKFEFVEVCAGMLDGSGNFAGVAAKELKEELDIEISASDLTNLSELSGAPDGMYLSPGACEETIRFFAFTRTVSRPELNAMQGKCTGALDEGEQITLKIIELDELLSLPDAKSVVAYTLFQQHKDQVRDLTVAAS